MYVYRYSTVLYRYVLYDKYNYEIDWPGMSCWWKWCSRYRKCPFQISVSSSTLIFFNSSLFYRSICSFELYQNTSNITIKCLTNAFLIKSKIRTASHHSQMFCANLAYHFVYARVGWAKNWLLFAMFIQYSYIYFGLFPTSLLYSGNMNIYIIFLTSYSQYYYYWAILLSCRIFPISHAMIGKDTLLKRKQYIFILFVYARGIISI